MAQRDHPAHRGLGHRPVHRAGGDGHQHVGGGAGVHIHVVVTHAESADGQKRFGLGNALGGDAGVSTITPWASPIWSGSIWGCDAR